MPTQDDIDYQNYLDEQEYRQYLAKAQAPAQPRKTSNLEGMIRGAGDGMVPGTEARIAASGQAFRTGNQDALNTIANPLLDGSNENSALYDAVQGAKSVPRDDLGIGGLAGRVMAAPMSMGAGMGNAVASKIFPNAANMGRMGQVGAGVAQGAGGNAAATTGESLMEKGELPSGGDLLKSLIIGGALPLAAEGYSAAKDGAKYVTKALGGMAARMTPGQAEAYAKNPGLVKQLFGEYDNDPSALMKRGQDLGKDALSTSEATVADLAAERSANRAGKTVQVVPEQFKGTAAEAELERTARTDPRNWKAPASDDTILNNAGAPINPPIPVFVPPKSMSIPAGRAGDLASDMGKNAGFQNQAFSVMQPEAKAAQEANREGWSSMRKAVNGAVPEEIPLNAAIETQNKMAKTLGKTVNTNSSKMVTDQSVKARALAQELSPEAYETKKAYDAAMTMKPGEGEGITASLTKALGRKAIEIAGPASTGPKAAPNLQEVLAAIRASQEGAK